jgi:hypothetical protein
VLSIFSVRSLIIHCRSRYGRRNGRHSGALVGFCCTTEEVMPAPSLEVERDFRFHQTCRWRWRLGWWLLLCGSCHIPISPVLVRSRPQRFIGPWWGQRGSALAAVHLSVSFRHTAERPELCSCIARSAAPCLSIVSQSATVVANRLLKVTTAPVTDTMPKAGLLRALRSKSTHK